MTEWWAFIWKSYWVGCGIAAFPASLLALKAAYPSQHSPKKAALMRFVAKTIVPFWPLWMPVFTWWGLRWALRSVWADYKKAELPVPQLPRRLRGGYQDPQEGQLSLPEGKEEQ